MLLRWSELGREGSRRVHAPHQSQAVVAVKMELFPATGNTWMASDRGVKLRFGSCDLVMSGD